MSYGIKLQKTPVRKKTGKQGKPTPETTAHPASESPASAPATTHGQ